MRQHNFDSIQDALSFVAGLPPGASYSIDIRRKGKVHPRLRARLRPVAVSTSYDHPASTRPATHPPLVVVSVYTHAEAPA